MSQLDPVDRAFPPDLRVCFKPLPNVQNGGCYMDVYAPERDDEGAPVPLAIYLHGGAYVMGASTSIPYRQVRWLRSRGVAVASVEYRMLPHVDLAEIRIDVLDAYRFVLDGRLNTTLAEAEQGWAVDATRVSGWGASAGGCAVLLLAADVIAADLPRLRAIVPVYPMSDLVHFSAPRPPRPRSDFDAMRKSDAKLEEAYQYLLARPAVTGCLWAAEGETKGEMLAARETYCGAAMFNDLIIPLLVGDPPFEDKDSPLGLASAAFPPTFVVVGTTDDLILPEQSYRLVDKLKAFGVDAVAADAVGMGHGPAEVHQSNAPWPEGVKWWEEAIEPSLEFVLKYLKQ